MIVKNPEEVLGSADKFVTLMKVDDQELFRVYSPSFSFPQFISEEKDFSILDGIDPMQIAAFDDLFEKASGIPVDGYTVTLPPFPSGKPETDDAAYVPDSKLLGILNVKFVVSAFPLEAAGLEWVKNYNGVELYNNLNYRERAVVEQTDGTIAAADISSYRANRVVINATGPGRLVLADVMYPGWYCIVDGIKTPIEPYFGILRSVPIGPGKHEILFSFHSNTVYFGWAIALIGWTSFIVFCAKKWKRGGIIDG